MIYFLSDQRFSKNKWVMSLNESPCGRLPRKDSVGLGKTVRLCLYETFSFLIFSGDGGVSVGGLRHCAGSSGTCRVVGCRD